MSLKSKIEAVIYASEEPVTLQQLVGLLAVEAGAEVDELASGQASLRLDGPVDTDVPEQRVTDGGTGNREEGTAEPESSEASPPRIEEAEAAEPLNPEDDAVPEAVAAAEALPDSASDADKRRVRDRERAVRDHVRYVIDQLIRDYADSDRGIEIREVASGFRMGTKPEYHDAVRGFVKSLKPALKLTLPALETLAVVAYKQPVTAAEISEIRGVDTGGVLGGLMARKLIATAGRKQVIGRPMLYRTTRDFLLRFGLKDVQELPSMEEFERMAGELAEQEDLPMEHADTLIEQANLRGDAEHIREANALETTAANETNEAEQQATAEIAEGREPHEHQQIHTGEAAAGNTEEHTGDSDSIRSIDRTEERRQAEETVTAG